jgi:hypothetical protein
MKIRSRPSWLWVAPGKNEEIYINYGLFGQINTGDDRQDIHACNNVRLSRENQGKLTENLEKQAEIERKARLVMKVAVWH